MSVERISQVLNHRTGLTATQKLILLGIANHDGDGGAWPSIATLARYAEASERTVQRAISQMAFLGVVTVEAQGGGTRNTRHDRRPNRYEIHLDGVTSGVERGDIQGINGVTSRAQRGDIAVSPEPSLEPSCEPSVEHSSPGSELEIVDAWEQAFSSWYAEYPRKVGRPAALKAFKAKIKAASDGQIRQLIEGTRAWARHWRENGTEMQFIPHPSTFLNQERYNDEPPTIAAASPKPNSPMGILQAIANRDNQ